MSSAYCNNIDKINVYPRIIIVDAATAATTIVIVIRLLVGIVTVIGFAMTVWLACCTCMMTPMR